MTTKKMIYTELEALNSAVEEKLISHINSLGQMVNLGITAEINRHLEIRKSFKFWDKTVKDVYEATLSICPQVDKPFGTELDLSITADDFRLNYGTCEEQSLVNDQDFIQKNLLIGIVTLYHQDLQAFIFELPETQEAISLLEELRKINEAEYEAKQKAKEEAKAAEEAQKLAEKKAKAAARRKARREAKKAQTEAQN